MRVKRRKSNADPQALAIARQTYHACPAQNCKIFATLFGGSKVKPLRQLTAAMVLSLTFSVCVLAGQIEVNGAVAPPPPPRSSTPSTASVLLTVLSLVYS